MQIPHSLHSSLACERQHKSPHRLGACNPSNPEMITKIVIKFAQLSKKMHALQLSPELKKISSIQSRYRKVRSTQCAERMLNKIAKPEIETFTG